MADVRRIPVDLEELAWALEDATGDSTYYLDLETGDVFFLSSLDLMEEMEEIAELVESEPDRFVAVDPLEPHESYGDMEDFIGTPAVGRIAELLTVAIRGRGAFRRFKDRLAEYPEVEAAWYDFKANGMRARALEWLGEIGVEPLPRSPLT